MLTRIGLLYRIKILNLVLAVNKEKTSSRIHFKNLKVCNVILQNVLGLGTNK